MNERLRDVLADLENTRESSDGWMARCPSHDDRNPSLWVNEGDDVDVVVHCFASCSRDEIARSLGYDSYPDLCGNEDLIACPSCDEEESVSVDATEGETGLWYCNECEEGGTGAEYVAETKDISEEEAAQRIGGGETPFCQSVKEKEKQAPKPKTPEYSDAEARERLQAFFVMNAGEVLMRERYRKRRMQAQENRDRKAFDRWQGKLDDLYDHVLLREMHGHREVQRFDADTGHLDQ
jgi:hypothetical protein